MEELSVVLVALITLWLIGVISFAVWVQLKVVPGLKKMLDSEDPEERLRAIKTIYPPKFHKD